MPVNSKYPNETDAQFKARQNQNRPPQMVGNRKDYDQKMAGPSGMAQGIGPSSPSIQGGDGEMDPKTQELLRQMMKEQEHEERLRRAYKETWENRNR